MERAFSGDRISPPGLPTIPLNPALLKGCDIAGVFWGAWTEREPQAHRQNMLELLSLFELAGSRPTSVLFTASSKAGVRLLTLAARRAQGKVVIRCA